MSIWLTLIMSVMLTFAVVLACAVYILVSFSGASHLLATRIGREPLCAMAIHRRRLSGRRAVALSARWARMAVGRPVLSLPMMRH
jgi:hypothetical protein